MRLPGLPRQAGGQFFNELATILIAAMGHMKIDHGGRDLLMPKQRLHRMQARPRLNEMSGKTMPQLKGPGINY